MEKKNIFGLDRPLRIFNVPWHVAHQYELYKVPDTQWYHIINSVRKWSSRGKSYRPIQHNIKNVAHYEPGKYDLAVIHIDQQCIDEAIGKSQLYAQLNEAIKDIPKIVINHGTPYWPEVYDTKTDEDGLVYSPDIITKMKMLIGDNHVVYNSHRAKKMWERLGQMGKTSRTIIHGMDADEWWDRAKEPIAFTTVSPSGLPKYYNRQLMMSVKEKLKERGIKHIWVGGEWLSEDFDDYRNFISRGLIYFNPTKESPMPRSRTEAMLSGACVISLANHGAEEFIKQNENGFLVPNNPTAIADLIEELITNNYKRCIEIGQKSKETAQELFKGERFRQDWVNLIKEVLNK